MSTIKRYAIAGAGARGLCFAKALEGEFSHTAKLVGLYDRNQTRMREFCHALGTMVGCHSDFDELTRQARPDVLIVCTPDHTHDQMVELAFGHGLDVICEKPMATTVEKVRRIFELERRFGRKVRVTFNVRYATYVQELKKAVRAAQIGPIHSVHLEWFLDKVHGAEYFRRWHRSRSQSGGLLVHKATHHFDYVNWLLEDRPAAVSALGSLRFYGRSGPFRGPSCRTCRHTRECSFFFDTTKHDEYVDRIRAMYLDAEHEDGYVRDGCIFGQDIDIYDTMSVMATYRGGAQLAYSLTAYGSCEGYRLTLTGARGRIEAGEYFGGLMLRSDYVGSSIRIIRGQTRADISVQEIGVPVDRGEHGGGDSRLYRHLFEPGAADPLGQKAGAVDGAASCLLGICANQSIEEGRTIAIPDPLEWSTAEPQVVVTAGRSCARVGT